MHLSICLNLLCSEFSQILRILTNNPLIFWKLFLQSIWIYAQFSTIFYAMLSVQLYVSWVQSWKLGVQQLEKELFAQGKSGVKTPNVS